MSPTRTRLRTVDRLLEKVYGPQQPQRAADPLEELIYTILSQNTNDRNTARAYDSMRRAFPTWVEVMNAPQRSLARALRPGGLAPTKSVRIQRILRAIAERGPLNLDRLMSLPTHEVERELLQFDGVGYKTARCVLLFALGRDAFPIDTHIHRVLTRLGILPEGMSLDKAHESVPALIPKGRCYSLHLNLIFHGRHVCHARNPECDRCVVWRYCEYVAGQGVDL